jgi:hypothetical protein
LRRLPAVWQKLLDASILISIGVRNANITGGSLRCDNNWVENQIRPIALGRTTVCSREACVPANGLLRC